MTTNSNPKSERDRMAEVIYSANVKMVKKEIDQIDYDPSRMVPLYHNLKSESETGQAIIVTAFMDEGIRDLLTIHMRQSSARVNEELFSSNGPLDSFGSRISISYSFGLITDETRYKLDMFRRIRNLFAHEPFGVAFSSPNVRDRISAIDINVARMIESFIESAEERSRYRDVQEFTLSERFLLKSLLTTNSLITEMLTLPVCRTFHVNPSDILLNTANCPDLIRSVRLTVADCILSIISNESASESEVVA